MSIKTILNKGIDININITILDFIKWIFIILSVLAAYETGFDDGTHMILRLGKCL